MPDTNTQDPATVAAKRRVAALASGDATTPQVRVRRSRMMILVVEESGLVMLDYATRECVDCSDVALALLRVAEEWQDALALFESVDGVERSELAQEALSLLDGGFLVAEDSQQARLEARYDDLWEWDVRAALFHFSIKDPDWMTVDERRGFLTERVEGEEIVPFYTTNEAYSTVVALERPKLDEGIFAMLSKRRTIRLFTGKPVPLEALRDCLFAGLGITGLADEPLPGMGRPPLKMTPSGGARNPFEAYVIARDVAGLPPGVYHYSAFENSLGLLAAPPLPKIQDLVGGKKGWVDAAGAVIVLVANFRRTAWKYSHPNAYRVPFYEAGHIGQNIMTAATSHGFTANPTAAFCDEPIERLLGLDRVTQAALYALMIGEPRPGATSKDGFD
jgi:SagB-type dehydrogenase family enzyme